MPLTVEKEMLHHNNFFVLCGTIQALNTTGHIPKISTYKDFTTQYHTVPKVQDVVKSHSLKMSGSFTT